MDNTVERAIKFIWERYSDQVSLTDIAESALLSRFYFARLFRNTTGITPGRYLAAVRIYQAKRMLLNTPMTITDISFAVGYNSLGSFTNHFTDSVGFSPSRFRRASLDGQGGPPGEQRNPLSAHGAVAGTISQPEGHGHGRVYVGAFASPILQHPAAAAVVVDVPGDRPCCYHLPDIPEGTWFIHAVGMADSVVPELWSHRTHLVGGHDPVVVTADTVTSAAVRLRPSRPTDPPALLALPDLKPRRPGHLPSVTACAAVSAPRASLG